MRESKHKDSEPRRWWCTSRGLRRLCSLVYQRLSWERLLNECGREKTSRNTPPLDASWSISSSGSLTKRCTCNITGWSCSVYKWYFSQRDIHQRLQLNQRWRDDVVVETGSKEWPKQHECYQTLPWKDKTTKLLHLCRHVVSTAGFDDGLCLYVVI